MSDDAAAVSGRLFAAYGDGDLELIRSLIAADVVAHVTNADGGTDRVEGRDGFVARLPDTSEAELSTEVTQVTPVDQSLALTAIEIRASRRGRTLHNFAAFLARVDAGEVRELWMVEARPAYSDEFWS